MESCRFLGNSWEKMENSHWLQYDGFGMMGGFLYPFVFVVVVFLRS